MRDKCAHLISGLSSPFVIITGFGLWLVAANVTSTDNFLRYGLLFLLLIIGPPLCYILISMKRGHITDIHVAVREQRIGPFLAAILGASLLALIYHKLHAPENLVILAINEAVCGGVFALVSGYFKISIHAASYTGAVLLVTLLISSQFI